MAANDVSFGVVGAVPLVIALCLTRRLERLPDARRDAYEARPIASMRRACAPISSV